MNIADLIRQVRFGGLGPTSRILSYHFYRARMERHLRRENPAGSPRSPGKLLQTESLASGGRYQYEHAGLEIVFLAPDLARVSWTPGIAPLPYALARQDWDPVSVAQNTGSLATERLRVEVGDQGALTFYDTNNRLLRQDDVPLCQGSAWRQRSRLPVPSAIYGLGERSAPLVRNWKSAPADRFKDWKGGDVVDGQGNPHFQNWQTDPRGSYDPGDDPIYYCMPVYLALSAAGSHLVFYENSFRSTFTFPRAVEEQPVEIQFADGMLRYYVIAGSPTQAMARFTELIGRAPLPPRWALGYHQCRWGYRTEQDIREVAGGFQEHRLPISAIHLDIDYMDGFRVFTIDTSRFPDLKKLAADLLSHDIRLVTIIDPGVKKDPDFDVYRSGVAKGAFCTTPDGKPVRGLVWPGWSVYPDFTSPATRAWWGAFYPRLLDAGIAGIWHDMNEPTAFTAWGSMDLPLNTRHDMDGRGGDHREAHNLYALEMNHAGFDALRQERPERRPWIVSRSGWVGQARYAWNWTGDSATSWDSLRFTIPLMLGVSLSGQPYIGPDVGGFSGNPSAELYTRWFQLASFLPFFRTHSALGTERREPWVFGEPTTTIARRFLELRYRLMPYLYSLAWQASQTGQPLLRPLFWDNPEDQDLWYVEEQFLLGDALMVAPIVAEGGRQRQVTLPDGGWYDFWDGTFLDGNTRPVVDAPLERIPVFVRGGRILPMEESGSLVLHTYAPPPGAAAEQLALELYSDAGDGYGPSRLDRFYLSQEPGSLRVAWQSTGDYPFPYARVQVVLHGFETTRALVDGAEFPIQGGDWNGNPFRILVFLG